MRPVQGRVFSRVISSASHTAGDRHARQGAMRADILDRLVRGPERRIDVAAAVADQPHRQVVQSEIDRDLLVASAA